MSLGYLIDPAFQSVNENGRPLVGGHIEVFYHNSQSPYITKSDFDGTNNPFKVPLNSKGMAVLIADDSNAYDVFCYDAFNALFWSRDNVVIGGSGAGITEIVFFDYKTATYDDINIADGLGKLIVLKEVINMFNVAYAQMQYSVPLGSYVFTNIYNNNLTTYTISLDGTKTKQTIPIGGSSGVEFISFDTTFAQVGAILSDGKWPILVDETIQDSPYYYNLIYDNDGLEYIFENLSGTINRTYRLSGSGWSALSSTSFENSSNKVTTWSSTPSNTKYPSEKLVYDAIDNIVTDFYEIKDWIDITNEWTLLNGFSDVQGGSHTLQILFSPSKNIVHFPSFVRLFKSSSVPDNVWNYVIQYSGSRFYTTYNAPSVKEWPTLYGVYNGIPLIQILDEKGITNGNMSFITYTGGAGAPESICALSFKKVIGSNSSYGIQGPFTLSVTPIP